MLSEQELLLLSNFMYTDISSQRDGRNVSALLNEFASNGAITAENLKLAGVSITGGLNREQMADIMNEMKKRVCRQNCREYR